MEIELRRLIGLQVIVMGPSFIDNEKLESVKLLAVEEAGIWIQSQEAVDGVVGRLKKKPSSSSLAIFIPYAQISAVLAGIESTGCVALLRVLLDSSAGTPALEDQ